MLLRPSVLLYGESSSESNHEEIYLSKINITESELKQNEMMVLAQGGRPELEEESKYICRAKN